MLTNNKKSTFIKSIAMIMAVLMVLAVALTGCGNKAAEEAATKAENAQTTATEAKTAAEAVSAALKDYLKVTDAVTAAAIDAMIAEAIGDCLTIEDLAGYVKSDELTAVDNKLANYVLSTALAGEITKALEGYATSAGMTDSIADAKTELEGKIAAAIQAADKTATIDELNGQIATIAGDYLKKADKKELQDAIDGVSTTVGNHTTTLATLQSAVEKLTGDLNKQATDAATKYATAAAVEELKAADGKLAADIKQLQETVLAILEAFGVKTEEASEKSLAELLAEFSPADITALIAEKMSLTDWDNATEKVIDAIADLKTLVTKLYGKTDVTGDEGIYTHADRLAVNAAIAEIDPAIVVFDANDKLTDYEALVKALEYRLLRVPTVEAFNKLNASLQKALAVKTFDDHLADMTASLKALGCEHEKKIGDVTKKYQVVTIDNLNAFYSWNTAFDALLVKYIRDEYKVGTTNFVVNQLEASDEYKSTYGALKVYVAVKGTKANSADVYHYVDLATDVATYKPDGYAFTKVGYTINTTLTTLWAPKNTDETGLNTTDVALYKLPVVDTHFAWDTVTNSSIAFDDGHGKIEIAVATAGKAAATLAETYASVYAQLENCVVAINDANDTFQQFLNTKVVNGYIVVNNEEMTLAAAVAANKATKTDARYLEALSIEMCEPQATTTDTLFLIVGVKSKMEYALNLNSHALNLNEGQHSAELIARITNPATPDNNEYALYYDMMDKAWHLLFEEYQKRAIALLDRIINDYKSIADGVANDTANAEVVNLPSNGSLEVSPYTTGSTSWTELKNKGLVTDGFANAFLNGVDSFIWEDPGFAVTTGIKIEKKNFNAWALKNYYGYATNPITGATELANNNELAVTEKVKVNNTTYKYTKLLSDPITTLAGSVSNVKLLLMANTLKVKSELAALESTDEQFKDTSKRDVTKAFNSYLEEGIANLEEVYNRFLFEDYKKDLVNDLYWAAREYAEFYCDTTYNADLAKPLTEALEHYITGYSMTADTAATAGAANKLFPNEATTLLGNKTVLTYLNSVVVDKNAFDPTKPENYLDVIDAATTKKANVTTKVAEYQNVVENVAIKYNFQTFLKDATDNLQFVYLQYMLSPAMTAELVDLVEDARFDAMRNISIIEYQVKYNTDSEALLSYKTWYKQLLGLIASKETKTAAHFEYLWNTTVAKEIAKIKSSDSTWIDKDGNDGMYNIVQPEIIKAERYWCFGSAAITLDAAANHNTLVHSRTVNNDGTITLHYLDTAKTQPKWVSLY